MKKEKHQKFKNQKGAALMMALFFFTIATFIVTQLSKETLTESVVAARDLKKLKSYYSAKAGLEIALLRIKAYQQAKASVSKLPPQAQQSLNQQLNMIWQFPLPWPLPLPDDAGTILKDDNTKVLTKSLLSDLTFFHEITDAGNKIDINNLGSPIKNISEKTLDSLLLSFSQILENNEELSSEHSLESIKEVLNNVADWIDEDEDSRNGGDEQSLYPYEDQRGYPRNASLMTMSELMLIHKMDDFIFNELERLTTVNGTFGINVNTAEKDVLMSIDQQFTPETTQEFMEKRAEILNTGSFLDENSFDNLLSDLGFRDIAEIHAQGVPLIYSPLSTFVVESSGTKGNVETIIRAHVVDASALKEIFIQELDSSETEDSSQPKNPGSKASTPTRANPEPIQGKPMILYMTVD